MDYFAHQDAAQRKTWLLVVYFGLAVTLMTAAVYFLILIAFGFVHGGNDAMGYFNPPLAGGVTVGMTALIGIASLTKAIELSGGGEKVALLLGGRRINAGTRDLAERRLQNIVEEMALAAGLPVPPVFVLADEPGINAFAAGHSPADAVIGISRGAVDYLTRDELQGVVAHEFSHILRGDMRLNVRLIGLLYGILALSVGGYYLFRLLASGTRSSSDRDDKKGGGMWALLIVALGIWLIGSIGLFFGRLIKAAISRQREFLADASAVQFTRNPDGIAGALKKIGGLADGSKILSPEAENASHMFFANGVSSWFLHSFDTHPPLVERIRRIDPSFDGVLPRVVQKVDASEVEAAAAQAAAEPAPAAAALAVAALAPGDSGQRYKVAPQHVVAAVGTVSPSHVAQARQFITAMPDDLLAALKEPFSARAAVASLLLSTDPAIRQSQLVEIRQRLGEAVANETISLEQIVSQQGQAIRLPIIELAQGVLRTLAPPQYQAFRDTIEALIRADHQLSLFEFVLERTLLAQLERHFTNARPPVVRYPSWNGISSDAACVLAALSYVGHGSDAAAQGAFTAAIREASISGQTPAMMPRDACSLLAIGSSLDKLSAASPAIKKRLIAAAVVAVSEDGAITTNEAELLRAVADSLDCPLPPLASHAQTIEPVIAEAVEENS